MLNIVATATTAATIISKTTNSAMKSAANIATGRAATTTAATTGWPSGINGFLSNMFLDPKVTGLVPGEEHERSEALCATEYLTRLLDKACR